MSSRPTPARPLRIRAEQSRAALYAARAGPSTEWGWLTRDRPRGGGHHNTSPSSPPGERDDSPPRHRAPFEFPRRHSSSVSPRTAEPPLALAAAAPKRARYEPDYPLAGPGDSRDYGQGPPPSSWQPQRPAGQLPLPRLNDDVLRQQRWRPESYSPDARHQPEMSRRPDTRV